MFSTKYRAEIYGVLNGSYSITENNCSGSKTIFNGNAWSPDGNGGVDLTRFGRHLIGLDQVMPFVIKTEGESKTITKVDNNWDLNGIAYGNGIYVGVGTEGTIISSTDGFTWTQRTSPTIRDINGVTFGNGIFVAAGSLGSIITSSDGINWTLQSTPTDYTLYNVVYGNNLYVAIGSVRRIITSTDGITWTDRTFGQLVYSLFGITYGNGMFAIVGSSGSIFTSSDGATWTQQVTLTNSNLRSIVYGNGMFVAVGDTGTCIISYDGNTWTLRNTPTTNSLYGITYGNGLFVAVGVNVVLTSLNGTLWTFEDTSSGLYRDVVYNSNTYVVVSAKDTDILVIEISTSFNSYIEDIDLVRDYSVIQGGITRGKITVAYDYNTDYVVNIGAKRYNNKPIKKEVTPNMPIVVSGYNETCYGVSSFNVTLNGSVLQSEDINLRSFNMWFNIDSLSKDDIITISGTNVDESGESIQISIDYKVVESCFKYALYYVNKYGGVDFLILSKDSYLYNRNSQFDINTSYDINDPSSHQYKIIQNTNLQYLKAYTGELSFTQSQLITEMLLTPKCWVFDIHNNVFYAAKINIGTFNVNELYKNNTDLNNYTFDIEFAQDIIRRG